MVFSREFLYVPITEYPATGFSAKKKKKKKKKITANLYYIIKSVIILFGIIFISNIVFNKQTKIAWLWGKQSITPCSLDF